ncbi:MAG: methionyl-tRNA formyltransferase [Patescibacteria group bacterium]
MHITFAGTPNFSKKVLEELLKSIEINAVVTAKDKPRGRGQNKKPSPVKKIAEREGISVFNELEKVIDQTDLVLVAAYGEIIKKDVLEKPKHGFLNVHPSLLPKYRGPTPLQAAILNGDEKTGVTIMLMDEKIDHGPILAQKEIELNGNEYYKTLENKLSTLGGKLLADTVPKWINKNIKPKPQDDSKAKHTKLLNKKDGKINWNNSATKIEREIRAYNPWPGSYSKVDGKLVKIFKASVQKQTQDGPFGDPGKIYLGTNEKIAVQTGEDFLLIEELQIEGSKKVKSKDFLQGNMDFIGKSFH